MRHPSRRALLLLGSSFLALSACSGQSAQQVDQQILADVRGLEPEISAILAMINQYAPGKISDAIMAQISAEETAAVAALQSLSASLPAASVATSLQTVMQYINDGLNAIGAALPVLATVFPALATVVPIYDAAVDLVPGIEAWIASVVGVSPTPVAQAGKRYRMAKVQFTPDQARSVLHIPIVANSGHQ